MANVVKRSTLMHSECSVRRASMVKYKVRRTLKGISSALFRRMLSVPIKTTFRERNIREPHTRSRDPCGAVPTLLSHSICYLQRWLRGNYSPIRIRHFLGNGMRNNWSKKSLRLKLRRFNGSNLLLRQNASELQRKKRRYALPSSSAPAREIESLLPYEWAKRVSTSCIIPSQENYLHLPYVRNRNRVIYTHVFSPGSEGRRWNFLTSADGD